MNGNPQERSREHALAAEALDLARRLANSRKFEIRDREIRADLLLKLSEVTEQRDTARVERDRLRRINQRLRRDMAVVGGISFACICFSLLAHRWY